MLQVKKHVPFKLTSNKEEEYLKNQNEIKNSIKNLYIGNQSKKRLSMNMLNQLHKFEKNIVNYKINVIIQRKLYKDIRITLKLIAQH